MSRFNQRLRRLEHKKGDGLMISPNADGSLPDSFRPFTDGVDYADLPSGTTITWKGELLDELAMIASPNALSLEDALSLLG